LNKGIKIILLPSKKVDNEDSLKKDPCPLSLAYFDREM
jgi:hypothetical protein